tara:strand:+ start:1344 stop:2021 length:678 start_codon:yes stop_codon:yes gene_type:complete
MKNFIIITIAALFLSSCKIVQSTSFNDDNSGEISVYVDMEIFASKMGEDAIKKESENLDFEKKKNKNLNNLTLIEYIGDTKGVTNVRSIFDEKKYIYGFRLNFDNTSSLNNAMNRMQHYESIDKDSSAVLEDFKFYIMSEENLIINAPDTKKNDADETQDSEQMGDKMAEVTLLEWNVNFASKKIKKIDSKFEIKKKGKKQVSINTNLFKMGERVSETIATIYFE